jgi:TetR/AcrR family transcriptional regulator
MAEPSSSGLKPNIRGRRARAAVIAAATALFAERGYSGTSIADVAAAAGVAKPSILYHFSDKDDLWRSCVAELWADVDAFYNEHWPRGLPAGRPMLERALGLFIEAARRWPAYIRIPFIEGATPGWRSDYLADNYFSQHVGVIDRILRAAQAQGALPAGDPVLLQALLTSSINVLVTQNAMWSRAFDRDVTAPDFLEAHARLILDLTFRSETIYKPASAALT